MSATEWQKEIYLRGFAGSKPLIPVDFRKLEKKAKALLSAEAFAYIAGGAGRGDTIQSNRASFERVAIVPRQLRDVSIRDTSIEIFGQRLPSPFLLSPIGVLELAHEDADVAVGQVASALGIPFIFSNQASRSMEDVAASMIDGPRWFQLYWSKSNDLVASFVQRAERCGCTAIVVTLDTSLLGWRTKDLEIPYLPFLFGMGIAQYTSDPVFQRLLDEDSPVEEIQRKVSWSSMTGLFQMVKRYPGSGFFSKLQSGRPIQSVRKFVSIYSNPSVTWDDLKFLRQHTRLPILLKGILHPDDARRALDAGMDGIFVSNHGGRQVDGSISSFEALPAIVQVVNGKIPVVMDSGVRGGADAFKALAMGATAIGIGRPYAYGLAIAGGRGVYEVLKNILADFELTMALAGCKNVAEIGRACIVEK